MKKLFYILPAIIIFVVSFGFLKVSQTDPNADLSPSLSTETSTGMQGDTTPPAGFPYPTQFNFNHSSIAGLNAGTVGAMYVNGRYYFNRWNSTDYYIYDNAGPGGGPGTQVGTGTYTGQIRDMAYDGRYLYGGKAATILYRLDTGNLNLLTQFTLSTPNIRAIAWDPNRKGFWHADFAGNIVCHDTANVIKGTITTTLAAKYGLGWDSTLSTDTAWVWAWDQTTLTANSINKFHAATGTLKASYSFNLPGSQIGTAGGAEVVVLPGSPPRLMLLLNYQNVALVGYKMKDIITGLEQTNNGVREFRLGQNYPNPFNPNTKIEFTLTKAGDVTLEVFDVNGQLVETLISGYLNAGPRKMDFNASHLSTGTYFYKITANGYSETKKMLLVK